MNTTLWMLGGIICNMFVGACVWGAMDKDHNLYRWYTECPEEVSWLLQPLVLMGWPAGLWLWLKK